jgi:hypothetical protein
MTEEEVRKQMHDLLDPKEDRNDETGEDVANPKEDGNDKTGEDVADPKEDEQDADQGSILQNIFSAKKSLYNF